MTSESGGEQHDGPLASVHTLDPGRPKRKESLPQPPAALKKETPAPDRNAALSMLGTFDLDDVDVRSPDEIFASLDRSPEVSGTGNSPTAPPTDSRADGADVSVVVDVQTDEILRELEEHHQRQQRSASPSAPRGSAELQPIVRRQTPPTRERGVGSHGRDEQKPRAGRNRLALSLAAAVIFTATASAVTVSRLSGAAAGPTTVVGPHTLAARTEAALNPTKIFVTAANAIVTEERRFARRSASPSKHHHARVRMARKHSARHRLVAIAPVAPAASAPTPSPIRSYSSSSSAPASSSYPASSTPATAARSSAAQQSQPAFGSNGSLGPGRGAPGTQ